MRSLAHGCIMSRATGAVRCRNYQDQHTSGQHDALGNKWVQPPAVCALAGDSGRQRSGGVAQRPELVCWRHRSPKLATARPRNKLASASKIGDAANGALPHKHAQSTSPSVGAHTASRTSAPRTARTWRSGAPHADPFAITPNVQEPLPNMGAATEDQTMRNDCDDKLRCDNPPRRACARAMISPRPNRRPTPRVSPQKKLCNKPALALGARIRPTLCVGPKQSMRP